MSDLHKKGEAIRLWKACFEDSEEFIKLYFDKVYHDEDTLLIEEDGHALAHIQMLPYEFAYNDLLFPFGYISGACTMPDCRGKGLMRSLLADSLKEMFARGDVFTALIPQEEWLYGYYHDVANYVPAFSKGVLRWNRAGTVPLSDFVEEVVLSYDIKDTFYVKHSRIQAENEVLDFTLAPGGGYERLSGDAIVYYMTNGSVLDIRGIVGKADVGRILGWISPFISNHREIEEVSIIVPDRMYSSLDKPMNMIRVVNLKSLLLTISEDKLLLERFAREFKFPMSVNDPILRQNNCTFIVENGRLDFMESEKSIVSHTELSIEEFMERLLPVFGKGFINLMMD